MTKTRKSRWHLLVPALAMVMITIGVAGLAVWPDSPRVSAPEYSAAVRTGRDSKAPTSAATLSQLRTQASPFDESLESKENMEFLLSPALLIQEAISDDVILYPNE